MPHVRFQTTLWTQVRQAKGQKSGAVSGMMDRYAPPLRAYVRNHGFQEADAEDVVQEVFFRLFRGTILERADAEKGKFRSLLLGITNYVMKDERRRERASKRGGGKKPLSLDASGGEGEEALLDSLAEPAQDDSFDELWVRHLVDLGMTLLRDDCDKSGTRYHDVMTLHLAGDFPQEEIARRLGCTGARVRQDLHAARLKLKEYILREIRAYASSPEEYEEDASYFRKMPG